MYLTKQEAKDWIPILQAFVDGKPIKMRSPYVSDNTFTYVDLEPCEVLPVSFINHTPITPDYYKVD